MEFNDQWPPLAAKGSAKINDISSIEGSREDVVNTVNEMFGDILEPVIILSVLQNCNWELQPTIDGLITLSETVKVQPKSKVNDDKFVGSHEWSTSGQSCKTEEKMIDYESTKTKKDEIPSSFNNQEPAKAQRVKKSEKGTKNRMDSFCGNIAKLKSSDARVVSNEEKFSEMDSRKSESSSFSKNIYEKQKTELLDEKSKKNESESFCGLKVQYRLNGMESSSDDDDDADVVIEDEASGYEINLSSPMSVSHFLSQTMQSPPQRTKPNLQMINTPSPPRTPQRTVHDATLVRIKGFVKRGEKVLVILRGLPGSGKTTLARNIVSSILGVNDSSYIFSTDDFFVDRRYGLYKYDPMRLSEAHTTTQRRVSSEMKAGRNPIIVDNTNIQVWEMRPYAAMAVENGYIIEILEPNTPWARNPKILAQKNTHNVPRAKIEERISRFDTVVSGKDLLDLYGLKYLPKNKPPQLINQAPISQEKQEQDRVISRVNDTQSNWDDHEKRSYVLTSRDIESIKNIDETYDESEGNRSTEKLSKPLEDASEDSMIYADNVLRDCLRSLSYSDNEDFEKLDSTTGKIKESSDDVEQQPEYQNNLPENPETKNKNHSASNSHQLLGAIGSERKASLSVSPNPSEENKKKVEKVEKNKENVLSQCWDFTLLLGRKKLHSRHGHYVSSTALSNKNTIEVEKKTDVEEKLKNNTEEKNIEKNIDLLGQIENEDCVNLSEKNEAASAIENIDELDKSLDNNYKLISESIEEVLIAEASATVASDIVTCKLAETLDISSLMKSTEGSVKISNTKMLDSCSETSIYEDAEDPEKSFQSLENNDSETEQSLSEISVREKTLSKEKENILEEFNEEGIDSVDLPETGKVYDDPKYTILKNSSDKDAAKSEENEKDCNPLHKNINSISWEVSPFPVDHTKIPTLPVEMKQENVAKVNAGTMTMDYAYDADYCGEASGAGHRILWGVNRPINSPTSQFKFEASSKIMFDKSSMTEFDREKDSTNRLEDLIDMFSNYPSEYLKQLYEQQCNHNFEWAVEVLMDADPPNLTIDDYKRSDKKEEDELTRLYVPSPKFSERKKFKRRSHSSSPRNRRTPVEDFTWPFLEPVQDRNCSSYEILCSTPTDNNKIELKEDNLDSLAETSEDSSDSPRASCSYALGSMNDLSDDECEETLELNVGHEFIHQLESICGNPGFTLPDELNPVLKIKKSMVDELYGLWIKSVDQQINVLHAQLDERMAKDEAMARAVDLEQSAKSPEVPNFEEIMNMEMAYAIYQNQSGKAAWETPDNMASRLTKQMLYQLFPDMSQQMLNDLLRVHGGNFKETCAVIEANIGYKITNKDMLEQQKKLLKRINEEKKNQNIEQNEHQTKTPLIVVNPDILLNEKMSKIRYNDTIERAQNMRFEAQREYSLRIENFNKAAEAYRKNRPSVAAYHSEMAKLHSERSKAAHADAAAEFLTVQTYTQSGEDVLDLHNLYVRQALEAVEEFIELQTKKLNRSAKRTITFTIITGHGTRTGSGKIKRAVMQKLISKNIRFIEENKGCLRVTLIKRNSALD